MNEAVRVIARPLFAQGTGVFVAECCGRVYVGKTPPKGCKTCGKAPDAKYWANMAELEQGLR